MPNRALPSDSLHRLVLALRGSGTPHVFIGAAAASAHGVTRPADRLEVCLPAGAIQRFIGEVRGREFAAVALRQRTLTDVVSQTEIVLLASGEPAGDRFRYPEIVLPSAEEAVEVDGLRVASRERLIEIAIAASDLELAAELAAVGGLTANDASRLHPTVRGGFVQVVL